MSIRGDVFFFFFFSNFIFDFFIYLFFPHIILSPVVDTYPSQRVGAFNGKGVKNAKYDIASIGRQNGEKKIGEISTFESVFHDS